MPEIIAKIRHVKRNNNNIFDILHKPYCVPVIVIMEPNALSYFFV